MTTYFTADTHFGHANIIGFCHRPFRDVAEMNRTLIANWNARVTDDDDVYILGDFAFRCTGSVAKIAKALKGRKHLVVGNHDSKWMRSEPEALDEFVEFAPLIEIDGSEERGGRQLTLCHYPLMTWRNSKRDSSWLIYGHIHANKSDDFWPLLSSMPRALNAGVDINWFYPVTFEELIENNEKWKAKGKS